jgi:hypothetical protein
MGILDGLLSPALTAATQAAGAYQGAEAQAGMQQRQQAVQALMLQRQMHEQEIEDALHRAQTNNYIAQDRVRQAAAAKGDQQTAVRVAIMRRDPAFADYSDEELSGLASDPVTFQNATGFGRSSGQFLRGVDANGNPTYGYGNRSTGVVSPTNFSAPLPHGGRSASNQPTPQQAYSQTFHNFTAVDHQLNSARHDLAAAQKTSLPLAASPADSAEKRAAIVAAVNRVKGLEPLDDSLSAAMRGNYSVPGHVSGVAGATSAQPQPASAKAAAEYQRAAQALQQAGGPGNAQARALYDKIVSAIAQKYGHQ